MLIASHRRPSKKMMKMGSLQSSKSFLSSSTLLLLLCILTNCNATAVSPSSSEEANVYIVYTERPPKGVDIESFHVKILASVLGSEEAAKKALTYVYKYASIGFSAKLTPRQVAELSKKPGVLQIVPSQKIHLDDPSLGKQNIWNVDTLP